MKPCRKHWATNLYFGTNYAWGHTCFGTLWSVSMEFQMYLLAPVVVWFYAKRRRWGYYAAVAFILTCLIIRAAINIYYGFSDYGSGTWKTGTSSRRITHF